MKQSRAFNVRSRNEAKVAQMQNRKKVVFKTFFALVAAVIVIEGLRIIIMNA